MIKPQVQGTRSLMAKSNNQMNPKSQNWSILSLGPWLTDYEVWVFFFYINITANHQQETKRTYFSHTSSLIFSHFLAEIRPCIFAPETLQRELLLTVLSAFFKLLLIPYNPEEKSQIVDMSSLIRFSFFFFFPTVSFWSSICGYWIVDPVVKIFFGTI